MLRRVEKDRPQGRSGSLAPLIVGAGCFTLLVGAAVFLATSKPSAERAAQSAVASTPAVETAPAAEETPDDSVETVEDAATVVETDPAELPLADRVAAHLAAGEFGAAMDVALEASAGDEQNSLIRRVVNAHIQAGDFDGAVAAVRRIPNPDVRNFERGRVAQAESLAGGFGADFDALIELIQNETAGPWFDLDGIGGTISEFESGVRVDPNGLLSRVSEEDLTGRLAALGVRARAAALNEDMARPTPLRLVSLTRLEREVARRLEAGEPVVESMRQLAGLSQISYVFVYPEDGEVVIAGPAEGWQYNEYGMPVGVESGRPTLQLDDLVTVLRTYSDGGMQIFGCSIDPRQENLKTLREFAEASQANGPLSPGGVRNWSEELGEKLGRQDITIYGVPANSRVARVLVEADYRMKLIGVGKMDAGPHIPDYFDLLARNPEERTGSLDALRWWMTMQYESVQHSEDRNAFEVRGSSVLCQSENQFVNGQGGREQTGQADATNQMFAANFTQHYADLARRDPVFADLQGVFDLALVAALVRYERIDDRLDWDGGVFAMNGAYRPAAYHVPREVDTVVNHRVYGGRDVVVQVAGGVRADLLSVLNNSELRRESPRLSGLAEGSRAADLPEGRWWWDAQ